MNPLLDTTLQALGLKDLRPTPLDKKLLTDPIGRTLPMQAATYGTGLASWLGMQGDQLSATGYTNHGTAYSVISYILATCQPLLWAVYALDKEDGKAKPQPKHPLANLLYRPNPQQSWADFKTECEGGMQLHGEVFIRKVKPPFGTMRGKTAELWAMLGPTVQLLPLAGLGKFETPTGYRFTDPATGKFIDYPAEEVIHLKYWNPQDPHRGLSPISAGIDAVTAAKAGLESRVRQYQNQGPAGLIFSKSTASGAADNWTAEQAGRVQQWFGSFFRGGRRSGQIPIVNKDMGFLSMGLSPVDLDVLAAIPHDKDAICDLYRFPGQLLNGSKGTTFSNMGEAGAALYSRCVIPLETLIRDGLNRDLGAEYGDEVYLDFDTSHIPELQEDKKALAEWLALAYWIPFRDKQRMMGVEVEPDDSGLAKYFIPATLIDPLAEPAPVPEDLQPTPDQLLN
jgi:HK97 family phage portal protein